MATFRQSATKIPELFILTAVSFLTRCWGLFHPRAVVWDETHYERFASAYFTGRYYVDVHPPFAKMLIAGTAKLFGTDLGALASNQAVPELRVLPAIAGALLVPVVYLLLRELGAARKVALLGGVLVLVDNALLLTSRLILIDSLLILFIFSCVLAYVAARRRTGAQRWMLLACSALLGGMAVSTKWTGLSALGLVGLAWAAEAGSRRGSPHTLAREGVLLLALPVMVYVAAFAVHFSLLTRTGVGDGWMSRRFQATLEGNPQQRPGAGMPFVAKVVELNRVMTVINAGWATDTHRGASPWYTWPIAKRSMGFWTTGASGQNPERWLIFFGNPLVWWGALAGMLVTAGAVAGGMERLRPHRTSLAFLGAGYLMNFLPFAFIQRPMYLYHYFVALIFSAMIAVVGMGVLAGWSDAAGDRLTRFPTRGSRRLYLGLIGGAALLFAYMSPLSYGWPITPEGMVHRRSILERNLRP